ncbi:MAG: fructosamine kinase family protein [Clostridia bacterium]
MIELIAQIYSQVFDRRPSAVCELGRGCYGIAYLVQDGNAKVVIKTYTSENFSIKEATALRLFKEAGVNSPEVFGVWSATKDIPLNALIMEYIDGKNGEQLGEISLRQKVAIADSVVDALLQIHARCDRLGYGDVEKEERCDEWQVFYRQKCEKMLANIKAACEKGEVCRQSLKVFVAAYGEFDKFFVEKVAKPSLIHGDYNMSNIMINNSLDGVAGVIDPICSMWGDREIELFQLDSGVGKDLHLLENYQQKCPQGATYAQKSAFYKAFAEYNHYARIARAEDDYALKCVEELKKMTKFVEKN